MKKKVILFLSLIIILQSVHLIWWVNTDESNPFWDQSWHLMISLNKYNQLLNIGPKTQEIEQTYPVFSFANNYYPPLYHITTVPFYLLFGTSYDTALLTNLLYFIVLVVSAFFIGKKLKNWKSGVLLAFILSTLPILNDIIREYLIDFSLLSLVALSYCFLLYSENFKNKLFSILFGISLGLGLLLKWTFIIYLLVPIYYSIKKAKKKDYQNIIISFIIGLFLASLWYVPKFNSVVGKLIQNSASQGDSSGISFHGVTYYLSPIINGLSFFYFIIFIYLLYKTKDFTGLYNILFIYSIFTLLPNKDIRYVVPIFLFISIYLVRNISFKKHKLITVIVVVGLLLNMLYTVPSANINFGIGSLDILETKGKYPGSSEINIPQILQKMNESKEEFSVCVAAESPELNDVNLPYYSLLGEYPVSYMVGNGCNPRKYDFTVTGPISETWRAYLFKNSIRTLEENKDSFVLVYSDKYSIYKMR